MDNQYKAPPSPSPGESGAPTPTVSVSGTAPPESLPKTGSHGGEILAIGLTVLAVGVAIQLTMRKLRRNEN